MIDNPISGFWLRSCPEDPNKSIIVFLSNEHFQDNDMVKGRSLFLARTIYMIKRYVGNSQLDISTQYLNRLTDKMFKGKLIYSKTRNDVYISCIWYVFAEFRLASCI